MKARIWQKHIDKMAERRASKESGLSVEEGNASVIAWWKESADDPDPLKRQFFRALARDGVDPTPTEIGRYMALHIRVIDYLPFIEEGYTRRQYEKVQGTAEGTRIREKYDGRYNEHFRTAMEIILEWCESGQIEDCVSFMWHRNGRGKREH